ncbi:hypothetical protein MATL_G00076670 [Megalops atlanticus]|uniref:SH3 domain-containing protein n=1 Tax=Megalops atlanticus TaxID=7932 RepID=A0A9D3Q9U7_MEGAT|nr:hypothetical protein MATL_G00076670 [Megalops atlanticus]
MACIPVCMDIVDSRFSKMENILAKALYDNTAECPDELAFRKGDIVTVMEQNVTGSHGWWKCSLHGRQGLAPANRLLLLSPSQAEGLSQGVTSGCLNLCAENPSAEVPPGSHSPQNIYQIPSIPRPSLASATYECMDRIYKVPSIPHPTSRGPASQKPTQDRPEGNHSLCKVPAAGAGCSPKAEVYDVPTRARHGSLFAVPTHRTMIRKASLIPTSELEQRYETGRVDCTKNQTNVYAVPPSLSQDPSYDIPVPSSAEAQQRLGVGYSTLPIPRKSEWIYDVPVSPEKPGQEQTNYGTLPTKAVSTGRQLYDTLPARVWPTQNCSSALSLYDIPKPSYSPRLAQDKGAPPNIDPEASVYDIPPRNKQPEASVHAVSPPSQDQPGLQCPSDLQRGHVPLDRRGAAGPMYDHPRGRKHWSSSLHCRQAPREPLQQDEEGERDSISSVSAGDSQRSSTASTASSSSTSSCDSLALSSSSPEPLREVTLSQEEAGQRLVELQEAVCQAVPRLMVFVSSRWRTREHLSQHLQEIRAAAESIASSIASFLDFALDVRGNARRLTDANLQTRLHKQLSIVEDSGLILQQAIEALSGAGWRLDTLSQDPSQVQTPDQLERFVMVARTVPEDVKRLVSILNANGKLLFKPTQRDPDVSASDNQPEAKKSHLRNRQLGDSIGEDNDYVQLQTKKEFEQQQKIIQVGKNTKLHEKGPQKPQAEHKKPPPPPPPARASEDRKPSLSEHCRLYFGALQKAISVFVGAVQQGEPPEKFIGHSKLVIMVGQKLVDTLCREAHSGQASQDLLCKSNHLCALLKQLAVATKKAAVHFPDRQALQEAQDFAKELAQRAQHFRTTLDL